MKKLLAPLASLKLTIVLLAMAVLLIYAGTWAQVDTGIWEVQKRYFHSFWVVIYFQTLLPRPQPGQFGIPGGFPFPGGFTIGGLMLLNLLAAHLVRFKMSWKRSGIILIHLGLILLLVGELLTSVLAHEGHMVITEGGTSNYSEDRRYSELAIIDPSNPKTDQVVAFPHTMLKEGATLQHQLLPFDIKIEEYLSNSQLFKPDQPKPPGVVAKATAGERRDDAMIGLPQVSGTDNDHVDVPSAYVTLTSGGQDLGRYLVSSEFDGTQQIQLGQKTYLIALRFARNYKPYSITLLKFSHDRYVGTDLDRNFSSRIQVIDQQRNVDREVLIRMNNPLRFDGDTIYQSGFRPDDKTTILQVVRNPVWTIPYFACVIGALGLLIHFGIMLVKAIDRQLTRWENQSIAYPTEPGPVTEPGRVRPVSSPANSLIPAVFGLVGLAIVIGCFWYSTKPSPIASYDYKSFGELPVSFDGRVMPFETLARTSLQLLYGRQSTSKGSDLVSSEEWSKTPYEKWESASAIRWLLDVIGGKQAANDYRAFRIDSPDVVGALGLDLDRKPAVFSWRELVEHREALIEQGERAKATPEKQRDAFAMKMADLYSHTDAFVRLRQLDNLFLVAPTKPGEDWQPIDKYLPSEENQHPAQTESSGLIRNLVDAYHMDDPTKFNDALKQYRELLATRLPGTPQKASYEAFFDRFSPFFVAQIIYVLVFTIGCLSWLGWARPLGRSAFVLLLMGLSLHTYGLISRIYISGYAPVTNLYSSAIFIAWAAMVFAVGLELYFRNVLAMVCASALGFVSLLIAYHLEGDGDTMHKLRSVLDSNGWLATHVVTITLGYSATFLAGVLAIAYIGLGVFTNLLTADKPGRDEADSPAKLLPKMVYAILCFAILFSFVGTVLGGIWADQSWGRFWGWDPKENGAVLIVLWNALILHARWAGVVRQRGIMLLAVFGNIVTSWSWFGTNMLGVGLHSYGFMDKALLWLLVFVLSQLAIIGVGSLPLEMWRSFKTDEATVEEEVPGLDSATTA